MVTGLPEGKGANRKPQDLHLCCHSRVTVAEGTLGSEASLFLCAVAIAASEKLFLSTDIHIDTRWPRNGDLCYEKDFKEQVS